MTVHKKVSELETTVKKLTKQFDQLNSLVEENERIVNIPLKEYEALKSRIAFLERITEEHRILSEKINRYWYTNLNYGTEIQIGMSTENRLDDILHNFQLLRFKKVADKN